MTSNEIISAICICLSAIIFSVSLQAHTKLRILFVQLFASLLFLANYLFVLTIIPSAKIGAITSTFEILRLIVFYLLEKSKKLNNVKYKLTASIIFCIILTICTILAWSGWISLFPLVAAILVSLALGSENIVFLKLAYIFQAACITTYLLLLSLWINAVSQIVVFIFGIVGLVLFLKNKNSNKSTVN